MSYTNDESNARNVTGAGLSHFLNPIRHCGDEANSAFLGG